MNLSISGLPALVIVVGFIVVFSLPVWLASRVVGADRPTMLRSAFSLLVGAIGSLVATLVGVDLLCSWHRCLSFLRSNMCLAHRSWVQCF